MSRNMTVKLSPYENAVNRLNDLPLELDRIFSEALEDLRRQRDEARASHQQDREGWDKTAERMETLMKSLTASRDEARIKAENECDEAWECLASERVTVAKLKAEVERLKKAMEERWYECHDGSESACCKSHE